MPVVGWRETNDRIKQVCARSSRRGRSIGCHPCYRARHTARCREDRGGRPHDPGDFSEVQAYAQRYVRNPEDDVSRQRVGLACVNQLWNDAKKKGANRKSYHRKATQPPASSLRRKIFGRWSSSSRQSSLSAIACASFGFGRSYPRCPLIAAVKRSCLRGSRLVGQPAW
jgi:hypothetical protein